MNEWKKVLNVFGFGFNCSMHEFNWTFGIFPRNVRKLNFGFIQLKIGSKHIIIDLIVTCDPYRANSILLPTASGFQFHCSFEIFFIPYIYSDFKGFNTISEHILYRKIPKNVPIDSNYDAHQTKTKLKTHLMSNPQTFVQHHMCGKHSTQLIILKSQNLNSHKLFTSSQIDFTWNLFKTYDNGHQVHSFKFSNFNNDFLFSELRVSNSWNFLRNSFQTFHFWSNQFLDEIEIEKFRFSFLFQKEMATRIDREPFGWHTLNNFSTMFIEQILQPNIKTVYVERWTSCLTLFWVIQ